MPRTLSQRQPQSKAKSNNICSIDDNSDSSNSKRQLSIRAFCFQQSKKLKTPSTPPTPPTPASTSSPLNDVEKNAKPLSINNINNNKSVTSSLPLKDNNKQKKRKLAQVFLDCGQQNWGQVLCPKCGTLYVPGVAEDTKMHEQICKPINLGVIWSTSSSSSNNNKKAKVLWCDNDKKNSILLIRPSEHSKYKAKLSQIQNIVDQLLFQCNNKIKKEKELPNKKKGLVIQTSFSTDDEEISIPRPSQEGDGDQLVKALDCGPEINMMEIHCQREVLGTVEVVVLATAESETYQLLFKNMKQPWYR